MDYSTLVAITVATGILFYSCLAGQNAILTNCEAEKNVRKLPDIKMKNVCITKLLKTLLHVLLNPEVHSYSACEQNGTNNPTGMWAPSSGFQKNN